MFSALLMFNRFWKVLKYSLKRPGFVIVFVAGVFLVFLGTLTYSLSQGWNVVDAFYFSVATLTTSSIADPKLVLVNGPIKIFTAFYVLVGIGVLVELIRQLGKGYVQLVKDETEKKDAKGKAARKKSSK